MAEKKFFVSREELQTAYSELQSTIAVAEKFGVSKKLILNYMKRFNIKAYKRNPVILIGTIQMLAANGLTALEIGAEISLSLVGVNRYIRLHNIKVKRYHKGFTTTYHGYILLYKPEHPNSNKKGYVGEHTVNITDKIGRPLREDEVVHHLDENKSNNDLSNLQLMTKFEHKKLHSSQPRNSLVSKTSMI